MIESSSLDSIAAFPGGIGALVASNDEEASSVGGCLDQGCVLWIQWII